MFIRAIGRCYVNSVGFNLYENKDGSATIKLVKGNKEPRHYWLKFDNLDKAEDFIDRIGGESTGASLVQKLKDHIM